jgi:Fe2+ or Zn2+ uptake regulation protein
MSGGARVSTADLDRDVAARLTRVSQRYTANRRRLVRLLDGQDRPLTMPELLASGDGLAQSSVYRNLVVLEQAGVVRRVVTDDEYARYELAEDLTGHHHHHLVCVICGAVEDFIVPTEIEAMLDEALTSIAAGHSFAADAHRLDLMGRCGRCS